METENEQLAPNEYYLSVHQNGYYLKTKIKEDIDRFIELGDNFLFVGKVKNNQFLHYRIGSVFMKKQMLKMYTANKPSSETLWLDDGLLELPHHSIIKEIKFGGREKIETYEKL
jgi:hypothetical protein